ncbi:MAG: cytochrome c oxidase subunit 3 [Bacteroidota bacterium]|nr:cytochrome c oxidase subunit 3 [Bacteroidota bacterium]
MFLLFLGITALFGALTFAYIYTRIDKEMPSIHIPWLFVINSIVLASSSYFIQQCRKQFDLQNDKLVLQNGYLTVLSTVTFLILQSIAWNQLMQQQLLPGSSGGHGYLYAISILHFLHVVAGFPFLIRILWPLYLAHKEGTVALFFISDPNRRKLKHTAWYWHFIDVMWIYLVGFFLINSLL